MNWSFFQRRVCLTLGPDWPLICEELERARLDKVWRYDAIPDVGPHQSFNHSMRKILADFYHSESKTLLHLEDDCVFRDLGHLPSALSALPDDWDLVYLGANLVCWNNGEPKPERHSDHLFRIGAAWTTHAIGVSKKGAKFILENQPGFSEAMLDNWLSTRLSDLKAYCVAPMVAYQRPHFSAIWNRHDDYTPIFEASEERLK